MAAGFTGGFPRAAHMPRGGGADKEGDREAALWCHLGSGVERAALGQLADLIPEVPVVLTAARSLSLDVPSQVNPIFSGRAPDLRASLARFLEERRIGAALFIGTEFPRLGAELCRNAGVPIYLVNAEAPKRAGLRARVSGLGVGPRRSLRHFDRVFAVDSGEVPELQRLGAEPGKIEVLGRLTEIADPLPCNEGDRAALSAQIATRPVWCAIRPVSGEFARIEAAHRAARRLSHRLLLILAPDAPDEGAGLAEMLSRHGWSVGLRSAGEEPEPDCEIYVADTEDEEGLWLRLAPISFIGGSLSERGARLDPYAAAVLGSAVISGGKLGGFRRAGHRLRDADALRFVATGDDLADAVIDLLAPERAAAMAARGWDITSRGADLIGRLADLIGDALDRGPA